MQTMSMLFKGTEASSNPQQSMRLLTAPQSGLQATPADQQPSLAMSGQVVHAAGTITQALVVSYMLLNAELGQNHLVVAVVVVE
jgi:hypothetical protein